MFDYFEYFKTQIIKVPRNTFFKKSITKLITSKETGAIIGFNLRSGLKNDLNYFFESFQVGKIMI